MKIVVRYRVDNQHHEWSDCCRNDIRNVISDIYDIYPNAKIDRIEVYYAKV